MGMKLICVVICRTYMNEEVVIKKINIADRRRYLCFSREVRNQMKVNHKNCLRTYGACKDLDGNAFIVMEKADCNLTQYLRDNKLDVDQKYQILLEIVEGMTCIHSSQIIHRDLKVFSLDYKFIHFQPDNIMMINGHVKISDFGSSRSGGEDILEQSVFAGTPKQYELIY